LANRRNSRQEHEAIGRVVETHILRAWRWMQYYRKESQPTLDPNYRSTLHPLGQFVRDLWPDNHRRWAQQKADELHLLLEIRREARLGRG
jgi:hypothetical protein